ncbi:XdhC family protein [Haloarchaeobius sp. FL176]|uniref:XdhC family protein n=1 Tax=Haloarchaeobius sp. FL176 TaxID=2967129 RepID=UPI00214881FF|nr:XdhC/CoxI family protein [Haloarchaeobius sp. FL176]
MHESAADPWSATALDVKRRLTSLRESGEAGAVATVVDVEGSAYRRPGAKMVLTPEGDHLGGITAGCLEGPVVDLAGRVFESGEPVSETFDLMDDEEWGLGLGCNGVIDVLVEPVDDSWDPVLAALDAGDSVATVTAVDGDAPLGARAVVETDGSVTTPSDRPGLPDAVVAAIRDEAVDCAKTGTWIARTVSTEDGDVTVFVDGVEPAPKMLVFGGQPDTGPVSNLARHVGFAVTVATARGGHADPERFPAADEVVSLRPADLGEHADERTAVVLMSHNKLDDELALASALETDAPYVGLMGPRERFEEIREELAADGVEFTEEQLARVATPVGLDVGGGEPVQIALSIVSEALAVLNGRDGGRLRGREGAIHGEREIIVDD